MNVVRLMDEDKKIKTLNIPSSKNDFNFSVSQLHDSKTLFEIDIQFNISILYLKQTNCTLPNKQLLFTFQFDFLNPPSNEYHKIECTNVSQCFFINSTSKSCYFENVIITNCNPNNLTLNNENQSLILKLDFSSQENEATCPGRLIIMENSTTTQLFDSLTTRLKINTTPTPSTNAIIDLNSSENITEFITTTNDTKSSKFVNVTSLINTKSDSIVLTKTTTPTIEELNYINSETTSSTTTQPFNDLKTTVISKTTTPTTKVLNSSQNITEFITLLATNDTNISQFANVTSLTNNKSDIIILTKTTTPTVIVLNSSQNITHFSTILTTNVKNSLQLLSATSPPYNKSIIILSIGIPVLFILAVFPLVHYFLVTKPQLKANANLELTSSFSSSYYTESQIETLCSVITVEDSFDFISN
jgi:hypothetical protein